MNKEKVITAINGFFPTVILLASIFFCVYSIIGYASSNEPREHILQMIGCVAVGLSGLVCLVSGNIIVPPNEGRLFYFMGHYKGTVKQNGWQFVNPLWGSSYLDYKVQNHTTKIIKVNDADGVPVEIAATIVYKLSDSYKNEYGVKNGQEYAHQQYEVSLRDYTKSHKYALMTTKTHEGLVTLLQTDAEKAGYEIVDAKITHLNYATEIAAAMLQKPQAEAIASARKVIVDFAVATAKDAAEHLQNMSEADKAKFMSNLIVVLCSEKSVSPVITV